MPSGPIQLTRQLKMHSRNRICQPSQPPQDAARLAELTLPLLFTYLPEKGTIGRLPLFLRTIWVGKT